MKSEAPDALEIHTGLGWIKILAAFCAEDDPVNVWH